MLIELTAAASGLYLLGQYIYHRIVDEKPQGPRNDFSMPIMEEGGARAKLFGRDRVRQPVLAWLGDSSTEAGSVGNGSPNSPAVYRASMLMTLGSGFQGGTHNIHGGWINDVKLSWLMPLAEIPNFGASGFIGGSVEILTGGSSQQLVDGGGAAVTDAGGRMLANGVSATQIPGYRNRFSVFLFSGAGGWYLGGSSSFPTFNFEASSYSSNHPQLGLYARIGNDANPVNVIFEVLTGTLDMLGLPESLVDIQSFQSAQYTLHTESHGYSRCWDKRTPARDIINDVLRQIDGFIYEDQRTGKICIRLARNDYVPADLPVIDRNNCRRITGFAMNSRANIVNKVRVVFENRDKDYADDSATAQNMANAAGQDGQVVEEVIEYRGCKNPTTAERLADRELGIRSKPVVKCSAHVSRSFLRTNIGDVVKLVWNAPDINAIFRVVGVDRGEPGDETIRIDLLLDANYVWRNQIPIPPDTGGIDIPPVVLGG